MIYYFPMITQILYEATSLVLALTIGIFAYPYMNIFLRMLFFQLVIWIPFYIVAYLLTYYQKSYGLTEDNQFIFNIHSSIELFMLLTASAILLNDKMSKYLAGILYILFAITLLLQVSFSGTSVFANYAIAASGFAITILYILIIYKLLKTNPSALKYSPEVWASLGLIIYAACNVPYFTMFHYLNKHHLELSAKLFHIITDVLANVRYLLLALAFWLVWKNRPVSLNNVTT